MNNSNEDHFLENINDFKSLISSAAEVAIIATDTSGIIRLFNKGAERMLGYDASEVMGKFTPEKFHLDKEIKLRGEKLSREFNKEVKGLSVFVGHSLKDGTEQSEWTYVRKNGSLLNVSVSVNPVYNDDGNLTGFLAVALDITKRKKAEQALKRSEKTIRDMADNIPGVIFQFYFRAYSDAGFHYLSPRIEDIFGIDSSISRVFENFTNNLHPDYKNEFYKSIKSAIEKKSRWEFEGLFLKPNGDEIWFNGLALPSDYDGELVFNGVLLDITDQKNAEIKLRESEERFGLLVRASFGGIGIHDNGIIIDCNMGLSQITGYSLDELKGMNGLELITPDYREYVLDKISSGYEKIYDVMGLRKDGTEFPLEIRGRNIPFQGSWLRVTEFRDITDRKMFEEYLKNNEEDLRATLNSIGEGVIATEKSGRIIRMNPAAEELTGLGFEESLGKKFSEVVNCVDEKGDKIVDDPVDRIFSLNENICFSEFTGIISKNGTKTPVFCSGAPVKDFEGKVRGAVVVIRDVSNESKLQEQLHQGRKLEAIGQLAGGVAHDFNNMLSGILGAAELMLNRHSSDEKTVKYCKMIMDASYRAGNLTSKLLAFARKGSVSSIPVNIHVLVQDAVSLLKRSVDKKIKIQSKLGAESSIVNGDSSQLENIFLNLGINSSHAMQNGGILIFSSRIVEFDEKFCLISPFDIRPGKYIEIEVRDTGTGIDNEYMDKIFEPYFTTKKNGRGTGLGLAAVYGIVQQHGGSVSVYSEKGEGTSFQVCLPLSSKKIAESDSKAESPVPGEGKILIVDDEEIIRIVGETILTDLGYEVLVAENGKEGFDIFQVEYGNIDLVILDMIMPVMNGKECFEKMKNLDPHVKVLLASGFSRDEDISDLKNSGLSGFIRKPFRAAELSKIVSKIISSSW